MGTKGQRNLRDALSVSAISMMVVSAMAIVVWLMPPLGVTTSNANLAYAQVGHQRPTPPLPDAEIGNPETDFPEGLGEKQKKELRKYRFHQMKEHGQELAKLAQSLQNDLDKSNENILSLEIVDKAQKIEKLAKKIQQEARFGT
jgi:hypothetical protein